MSTHARAVRGIAQVCLAGLVLSAAEFAGGAGTDAVKKSDFVLKPEVSYKAIETRDPFKSCLPEPPVPVPNTEPDVEIKLPELLVSGIFWGAQYPQAIINNIIVKVGDTILDAKVINIEPEGVTVTFNRRNYLLKSPATQNLDTARSKKEASNEKSPW